MQVCSGPGPSPAVVVLLLSEVLLLLGYFALGSPSNQAMLTWGRPPDCVLHRLLLLPPSCWEQPALTALLAPTLAAICCDNQRLSELVEVRVSAACTLAWLEKLVGEAKVVQQQQQGLSQQALRLAARYRLEQRLPPHSWEQVLAYYKVRARCDGAE
ncbi:hypothetical protein V8C86DRAFT_2536807 [Haematococcus lacustris]